MKDLDFYYKYHKVTIKRGSDDVSSIMKVATPDNELKIDVTVDSFVPLWKLVYAIDEAIDKLKEGK